ncbi:MAG TPA: dihydroorotate dehydrogenase, partial [Solirubrobacteraceae bacterium]|nr:dihydroorotate dehydrogenase [Solirubrobacteraceae bacterium]
MSGPVEFCGLRLAHRVINGSGTFDAIAAWRVFGAALTRHFPFSAYVSKTITLEPRAGNPPPRLWEAPGGMINSIGLPNKGLAGYLEEDLPQLCELLAEAGTAGHGSGEGDDPASVPLITNVMGSTGKQLAQLVAACDERAEIAAIELNVSCPNVETGLDIGADPAQLEQVVLACRERTGKPLIVKLTPNTADVPACAQAAESAGADAVSLINTLKGMALDPRTSEPWLGGVTGGVSGPAVRAIALEQVHTVAQRVRIPVIGMGGIASGRDAADFLTAGATCVAVGTESFRDPAAGARIAAELRALSRKERDFS